jgi:hypothetical protein
MQDPDTKILSINLSEKNGTKKSKKNPKSELPIKIPSIKKNRIITDTSSWNKCIIEPGMDLGSIDVQWNFLQNPEQIPMIKGQIQQKIRGYKAQDLEKKLYHEDKFVQGDSVPCILQPKNSRTLQDQRPHEFVDLSYVLNLLTESKLQCVYCHEPTRILYEHVREPKQWTLERIDNSLGHVVGNVQIACLICNLRRRTMYQERYILTKQMMHITKLDA